MTGQTAERKQWKIYHRDREYAQQIDDPVIAVIIAGTKEEAEREALQRFPLPSGAWAVEKCRKAHEPSLELEL